MIVAAGSVEGFFVEVVEEAIRAKKVEVTDASTSYLVSLLADYAKPNPQAEVQRDRPVAFLLDEAIHTLDLGERFEKLRTLGDGVLYTCGFFRDHFEARGVDSEYLMNVGATAYRNASSLLHVPSESKVDVFAELADKFASLAGVLTEVADATVAMSVASSRGVLKLYERWLRTRSDRLADALSGHGFVAPRGGRGVLQ